MADTSSSVQTLHARAQGYFVLMCLVNNIIELMVAMDKKLKNMYKRVCSRLEL
jgi:hypothetical protein